MWCWLLASMRRHQTGGNFPSAGVRRRDVNLTRGESEGGKISLSRQLWPQAPPSGDDTPEITGPPIKMFRFGFFSAVGGTIFCLWIPKHHPEVVHLPRESVLVSLVWAQTSSTLPPLSAGSSHAALPLTGGHC